MALSARWDGEPVRRFSDFRFPRDQWSAGEMATAAIGFTVGLLVIIAFGFLLASNLPIRF